MTETPDPQFAENDEVLDRARKYGVGIVTAAPQMIGGDWYYSVRFEGGHTRRISEQHLELKQPADEDLEGIVRTGRFGTLEAFQRALSVARIHKERDSRTTVYSFDAQRIQFQAHQYKPLLRFLDSADRRLLVADEVGLGKTIEAGIILAEMEARQAPDRVLVLCPSRLVEKWSEELNRKFGQEFDVWRTAEIQNYLRKVRQNPKAQRMRAIVSLQGLRREDTLGAFLDAAQSLDLLIVDEAHHARNRGTKTYAAVESLAAVSSAVVFLTATPIHLSSDDLFNQLRLLRPSEFRQAEVFAQSLVQNEGVVRALARIRTRDAAELAEAAQDVERAFQGNLFRDSRIDLVRDLVARMRTAPPNGLREWLELEREVERYHYLANILTRTRKREVQVNAAARSGLVRKVAWSDQEKELFRRMTAKRPGHSWPDRPVNFGELQRERMAASSLKGTLLHRGTPQDLQDLRHDLFDGDPESESPAPIEFGPDDIRDMPDSKLDELERVVRGILEKDPTAKMLIFTYFVGTSRYLESTLNRKGWKTLRIAGDVPSNPGRPDQDERSQRLRQFREDPEVRLMVSTEVGSEGLDFQFCSTIVNYDLPWNPMTVEQRIGRIDRFGQKADTLRIINLVVEGTIEERILVRLYERIGIFERSIGPLESILGEEVAQIRKEYFEGRLTPQEAEKRVRQSAEAIENRKAEMDRLDREADKLLGHEDFIRTELERVRRLGRYVTPEAIRVVLSGYLSRKHPTNAVVDEGDGIYSVRGTDALKQDVLLNFSAADTNRFNRYTRKGRYYFALRGEVAYERDEVDLLNASHPLVLTALTVLGDLLANPLNKTGAGRVRVSREEHLEAGPYLVASYHVRVTGMRERAVIETAAVRLGEDQVLDAELAERLLHLALTTGDEAPGLSSEVPVSNRAWVLVQEDVILRARKIERMETQENQLLAARREAQYRREHDVQLAAVQAAQATAIERGTFDRRMELMLAGKRDKIQTKLRDGLEAIRTGSYVQSTSDPEPFAVCLIEVQVTPTEDV